MYTMLNSPYQIGTLTIKNRVVMTAARSLLSDEQGTMTEDMIAYYERRAKGGVGLIVTEAVYVDDQHGISVPKEMGAARDESIAEFQKLSARIHPYGTKIFAQLFHPGSNGDAALSPGGLIVASAVKGKNGGARAATAEEIQRVVACFGAAALRVKQGGFDGVEVHGAHNYFIQSFLSPATNFRSDEFGGSLENRTRLLRLIVEEIRRTCGPDFPLTVRISVEEYIGAKGYHADEGIKICQMLEGWGADGIGVTASGTASKLSQSMEPITYPQGWRKHLMKAVKRSVSIPVCGVSVIRDPDFAEKLLVEGYTDFVGSVRAHLADGDWAEKALSGRGEEIIPCISCMSCLEMEYKIDRLTCALNPETGYEAKVKPLEKTGDDRLVLVLGAGPGGMECALIAAQRGFQVKLYEKQEAPGGQLLLAGAIPRKEKIQWLVESLEKRCREAGVQLLCNTAPTPEELKSQEPYAIIDATGGKALIPASIPGAQSSPLVCTPADIISGRVSVEEESVVVVGSGMTGLETAEILSHRERNNAVVVLEAAPRLAPGALGSNRNVVTAVLDMNNVVYMLNRRLTSIGEDRIYFEHSETGETYAYPCDRVVLCLGVEPENPYGTALETCCERVFKIGDAKSPGKIWDAIHEGYHTALAL